MSATDWVGSVTAVVVAVSAGATAVVAIRTLRHADRENRSRTRPMVSAELRRIPSVRGSQMLVIKNHGPSVARQVRVTFDPPLPEVTDPGSTVPYLKRRYENPIPVLTPGMELDNLYFIGQPAPAGGRQNLEPLPEQALVTITYDGPDGTTYSDPYPLDTWLMRNRSSSEASDAPHRLAKDALSALQSIADSLRDIDE